jgi:hypothetical protein
MVMANHVTRTGIKRALGATLPLTLCACGAADPSQKSAEPADAVAESIGRIVDGCDTVRAEDGWVNTFMPQSSGSFRVMIRGNPGGNGAVDSVIGLSNGPAAAFTDLGPIVRFNPTGNVDVRDGDHYTGAFPYDVGEAPFEFTLDVSIPTHTYTVWLRRLDPPDETPVLLGQGLRFRTEQSSVTRLDNIGRFMDGTEGRLQTCGFTYTAPDACTASQAGTWASRDFPAQSGPIRIEFVATASSGAIDAVMGSSSGAPTTFMGLAPIVRFRPDSTFDARNGSAYGADATVSYVPNVAYRFALDIDTPNHSYSAMVREADRSTTDSPYVVFARDFAFRTEQAQASSLDHLGQFVDSAPGSLDVCDLTVAY